MTVRVFNLGGKCYVDITGPGGKLSFEVGLQKTDADARAFEAHVKKMLGL